MLTIFKEIWSDLTKGENIELYSTVFVAMLLAVLNLFGIAQLWINSVTLAVLALLAVSSLVNRRKLEIINERLFESSGNMLLDSMPSSRQEELRKAKELWLVGIALNKTVNGNYRLIQEKLSRGDKIKVILVDPDGEAYKIIADRYYQPTDPKIIQDYILLTLSNLNNLKQIAPDNLEIRVLDYSPPLGMLGAELETQNGIMYIEHYLFKMGTDAPILIIQRSDEHWYDFYRRQILTLWENAVEWNNENAPNNHMQGTAKAAFS